VELAGSPLAAINRLGPTAVASDFGNNHGLILGPALPIERNALTIEETWAEWRAECAINGVTVGEGGAAAIPGTPWRAFEFAVERLLRRGYRLPADTLIATGASTGIHDVVAGDLACVRFWPSATPDSDTAIWVDIARGGSR
jgi:2-keto-4-pentenoate hydratase